MREAEFLLLWETSSLPSTVFPSLNDAHPLLPRCPLYLKPSDRRCYAHLYKNFPALVCDWITGHYTGHARTKPPIAASNDGWHFRSPSL